MADPETVRVALALPFIADDVEARRVAYGNEADPTGVRAYAEYVAGQAVRAEAAAAGARVKAGSSLRARLLVAAERAAVSNPWTLTPWRTAPPWVSGEAVIPGAVRRSVDNWYVAASGGTTGATAPSHTNGSAVNDGGVLWTYFGPAASSADVAGGPVVEIGTAIPSGFSATWPLAHPTIMPARPIGGVPKVVAASGADSRLNTYVAKNGTAKGTRVSWEFETDEDQIAFATNFNLSHVQMIVDGRRIAPAGLRFGVNGTNITRIAFPEGRSRHTVRVQMSAGMPLLNIYTRSTGQVWAPGQERIRAAFISDSIWAGSGFGPFVIGGSVPERVADLLGWNDPWDYSIGGTGYIAAGSNEFRFGERVPDAVARNPDVWLFMGSTNDNGQPAADITAAALAAWRAVRDAGSTAPIIVLGVWSNSAAAAVTEDAIKVAFDAFGDPYSFFIPIARDTATGVPWITGAWNKTTPPNSTNASLMIGGDGTHPIDLGSAYLARRMAQAIRAQVLPKL